LNTTETPPSDAGNRSILPMASGYVFEYTFIATTDHRRSEGTVPTPKTNLRSRCCPMSWAECGCRKRVQLPNVGDQTNAGS
jgi:hypothetical protein